MTDRETTNYRSSIQQVAPEGVPPEQAFAEAGQKIIATDQAAKINENFSSAQLDLAKLSEQYQIDNQDNPFGGMKDLQAKRDEILAGYGENISPFFKKQWQDSTRTLVKTTDTQNEMWAYKQTRLNTVTSINKSIQNNMDQANIDGRNFAAGNSSELDAILNFKPSKDRLVSFGAQHLGVESTTKLLENYNKDYMKSFLTGVAETNPQKAAAMLDSDQMKDRFTTKERDEMVGLIERTTKSSELLKSLKITENVQGVTDLINDPSQTYYQKRLAIDQMDMSGAITPKTAEQSRRLLNSKKDVDSITSSAVMADVVTKIYDINSQQGMNNADYLKGVQGIHDLILQKQTNGELNSLDVQKLNNEMKTLTSKRVSDATKSVGNDMYEATQMFQTLPPEYRGEATRQLFYKTQGQQDQLTPDQYSALTKKSAQQVIDNINADRRKATVKTLQTVNAPAPDDVGFLKTKGYTMDDVKETAKIHNITEAEVIRRLRAKK